MDFRLPTALVASLLAACHPPARLTAQAPPCPPARAAFTASWLDAWTLAEDTLLRLPPAPPPTMYFFDETCAWTTGDVGEDAPALSADARFGYRGRRLDWSALRHDTVLHLPDGDSVALGIVANTSIDARGEVISKMPAPSFWEAAGVPAGELGYDRFVTAIFLHEFSHARHIRAFSDAFDAIEAAWAFEEPFTSDVVQDRYGRDSAYVALFSEEVGLLRRAAATADTAEVRSAITRALATRRRRHATYFSGGEGVFATIDDVLVATEGAGQWVGYAWLTHPDGGGLPDELVLEEWGARGGMVRVSGLALFRAIDRMLPGWAEVVYREGDLVGATELLERAAVAPRVLR